MKNTLITYSLLFLPFFSGAQLGIKPSLLFFKDSMGAAELWMFEVNLTNTGSLPSKTFPPYARRGEVLYGEINLEFKKYNDSTWTPIECIKNRRLEILSYESSRVYLEPDSTIGSGLLFCTPLGFLVGQYQVRVSYTICNESKASCKIYSEPIVIHIVDYAEDDLLSYRYLLGLPDPYFIYWSIYNQRFDSTYVHQALALTLDFPKSVFTPYAELYLCQAYFFLAQIASKTSTESSINYLRLSKKYGLLAFHSNNAPVKPIARGLLLDHLEFITIDVFNYNTPSELQHEFKFDEKN